METKIIFGLTSSLEALNEVGHFIHWREVLAFSGIVFAISEFMEKNKFRAYVFKMSSLSKDIFGLIILSNLFIITANLLPLVDRTPKPIPFLHYPVFWELLSLITLTILLGIVLIFSLFPDSFIPKINRRNCKKFFIAIRNKIIYERTDEGHAAIATILDRNLDLIFSFASKYDKHWNIQGSHFKTPFDQNKVPKRFHQLVIYSRQTIDIAMSDRNFCRYLSINDIGFTLRIIAKTNKYELWHSCGSIFYNSLCKELFLNKESLLSREMEFRGAGVQRPVFNALFTSFAIIEWYRPFQSFEHWEEDSYSKHIIHKYIGGLEVAIEAYLSEERSIYMANTATTALTVALRNLPEILRSICIEIRKDETDEIYHNQFRDVISAIHRFYGRSQLGRYLIGDNTYIPKFSQEDLTIAENSLMEGIVESIFIFLEVLTYLENDDYARMLSTDVFWLILPVTEDEIKSEIRKNMEQKFLTLIKERVEENKKGYYSSMIKLLINIYGFQFHSGIKEEAKIGKYIEKEFKENLAEQILNDPEKKKKYLPKKYIVNESRGQIVDLNGNVMYERIIL